MRNRFLTTLSPSNFVHQIAYVLVLWLNQTTPQPFCFQNAVRHTRMNVPFALACKVCTFIAPCRIASLERLLAYYSIMKDIPETPTCKLKHLFCTTVSAGAREVGPYKLKNTVQGANTGRQFNKQNIDK